MAEKARAKRTIYFTCSTGKTGDAKTPAVEYRVKSPWNPGKSRNKVKN